MIHFFEGWGYPGRPTSSGIDYTNNILRFTLPVSNANIGLRGSTSEHIATTQVYAPNLGSYSYFDIQGSVDVSLGDRLVIGGRIKLPIDSSGTPQSAAFAFGPAFSTSSRLMNGISSSSRLLGVPSDMPYLYVTGSVMIMAVAGATAAVHTPSTPMPAGSIIASVPTTGIDMTDAHFYEIEYNRVGNEIVLYVDGILQLRTTFSYSTVTAESVVRPLVCSAYYRYGSYSTGYGSIGTIYAADERLGPVEVKTLVADGDVAVDSAFGTGPHFSKLNTSIVAASSTGISTTTTASAKFSMSNVSPTEQILGVSSTVRVSSEHVSADRTTAAVTQIVSANGSIARPTNPIPEQGYRDESIMMGSINPATGQPWTVDDVNNLQIGASFSIVPRAV